jgi:hypothetical protein
MNKLLRKVPKGIIIPLLALLYLCWHSFRNRGKLFAFRGLNEHERRRLASQPKSKEEICRNIFERIFGLPFTKQRPDWLINHETGKRLELDGFQPNIPTKFGKGLAFEYNGAQHYHFTPKYHPTPAHLESQRRRDEIKKKICYKRGVILIDIPYTVEVPKLESYIREKLYGHGLYYYIRD